MLIRLSRFIVNLFIISTTLTGNVIIGHDGKPKPGNNKTGESGVQNDTSCSLCRYRRFSVEKPVLPNVKIKGIPKGGSKTMSMSEVEFPYSMQQQLDDHLLSINLDYPSSAGDDVDLDCESDITDIIFQKFPMSEYHWIFNSKPLEVDDDRMTIDGGLLSIEEAQTSDSGIYVCKLEFSPGRRKTVAFFSVVVDSLTIDFHLDERKELKYRCPSSVFGLLYSKAFRTWELNGKVVEKMESLPTLRENQRFRISETNTPSARLHRIKRFFDYEGEEDDNQSLEEGEFPSKLEEDVEEFIHRIHQAYTMTDGEVLHLKCANELTKRIFDVFPKATYRWTLNNKAFSMDPARMIMMAGALLFQAVFVEDSGVYVCGIEYSPKVIKTVSFYSLVVTNPEPTVRIQATKPFELLCPSQFISTIYPHSVRSWALNGVIYKELHKIPSKKNGADLIPALEADMTGKWTCEVREPMGGKLWTVAFYHLRVDVAPPFWQQTLDSVKKNIIPLSVFSAIAVGGILTVLLLMVYKTAKEDADQDIAIESLKGKMAELKKGGVELNPESSSDSDSDSEGVGLNNGGGNGGDSKEVGLNSDGNSYPEGDGLCNGSDIGGDSDSEGTRLNNESTNDSDSDSESD